MRLFIAEKPDLAKAITAGIGGGFKREDGYFTNGQDCVTWCFGHMLALVDPEEIDEKYKFWDMQYLPIPPMLPAKRTIPKDKKKQVAIIRDLIKKAEIIVNAGDPDDEGQLLVDELLRFFNNKKPVLRLLINDNNVQVVKKAIANMKPNAEYEHLGWKAESRAIADQLFGYNLTRAYSLQAQSLTGKKETIHIGRVQTPILGLVVRRDRENASHKKSYYYQITGDFNFQGISLKAKYLPQDTDPIGDNRRIIDKVFADEVARLCSNTSTKIVLAETTQKKVAPPLPYNLLKLQQDASRKFGYKPDQVMAITQSLREKHQLITYNRSDCQYLSEEQHTDAPQVLTAIANTLLLVAGACQNADSTLKGRVFNSSKVSAHHAIIPTETIGNWDSLSREEQNVYKIIARSYIAQFYPLYEYDETKLIIETVVDGKAYQFAVTARVDTNLGWKKLYANDTDNEETIMDEDTSVQDLRQLVCGTGGQSEQCNVSEHETKPLPLYTITTLLGDLTRVAKYVKNPELAKSLKDKDKEKQGEHGGIGTPATRSDIIKNLLSRGYLAEKGKSIISTPQGQKLYDQLDDLIRYPDMTAVWHEQQKNIKNETDVSIFISQMNTSTIEPTIAAIKRNYTPPKRLELDTSNPCPKCGRPLMKKDGKFGTYWRCSGWNATENPCGHTMNDNNGKPIEKPLKSPVQTSEFNCKKCGKPLIWKTGTSKKTNKPYSFFSCSGFPKCKQNYDEVNGEPQFNQ